MATVIATVATGLEEVPNEFFSTLLEPGYLIGSRLREREVARLHFRPRRRSRTHHPSTTAGQQEHAMIHGCPARPPLLVLAGAALFVGIGAGGHLLAAAAPAPGSQASSLVTVLIETELGDIVVELDGTRAPITVTNFLRYVDAGRYDGGRFHRSVRLDNQVRDDVFIEVVQGGGNPEFQRRQFDPIPLERTRDTDLKHLDGTLSMARGGPDTARSDFFICTGAQASLDYGGERNADGQGFAAFGRVVRGMEVVRRIHQSPTAERERLAPPIGIIRMTRVD